jgi:hypothetical protein
LRFNEPSALKPGDIVKVNNFLDLTINSDLNSDAAGISVDRNTIGVVIQVSSPKWKNGLVKVLIMTNAGFGWTWSDYLDVL